MLDKASGVLIHYGIVFLLGALIGCIPESQLTKEHTASQPTKTTIAEVEKTFDPSAYVIEFVPPSQGSTHQGSHTMRLVLPQDSVTLQEEIVQGFRIQLYSSSNYDEAQGMKNVTQELAVPDSVYIVFDPPVYKLRVGDFVSRYEANQRLLYYISHGYRDAWVVPDRVVVRKTLPQTHDADY